MNFIMDVVYCLPIALQLAGALVLISSLKSTDLIIKDMMDSSVPILPVFSPDQKMLKIDTNRIQKANDNNWHNRFASWYIWLGYLTAVLFEEPAPTGIRGMFIVAVTAIVLLRGAVLISKNVAKKYAVGKDNYPADQVPEGTIAIELDG